MNTAVPRDPKSTRATWQSVMSQDAVSTAKIIVDSISSTPVATFRNPCGDGVSGNAQVEALVLASYGGTREDPVTLHATSPRPVAFGSPLCSSWRSAR
jgi:hypothetical protein